MELDKKKEAERIPWLGIIAIVYGLLAYLLVPIIAKVHHITGSDEKVFLQEIIVVLVAILISHLSLFKVLRKPQNYKWKAMPFIGIAISYIVTITFSIGIIMPSICERRLKSEIAGVTHIKVSAIRIDDAKMFSEAIDFEERDRERIREIIGNIKIAPFVSMGRCECLGDQAIEFYKGEILCVEFTCHHGESFRWMQSPVRGDLRLTNKSSAFFKKWLNEKGNYAYELKRPAR